MNVDEGGVNSNGSVDRLAKLEARMSGNQSIGMVSLPAVESSPSVASWAVRQQLVKGDGHVVTSKDVETLTDSDDDDVRAHFPVPSNMLVNAHTIVAFLIGLASMQLM